MQDSRKTALLKSFKHRMVSLGVSWLPKKKSTKDTSIEILNKLKDIEEKLKVLEDRLKSVEVKSHLSLEDQLFFGLVFSLLLLVVTFPSVGDMASFLEGFELFASNALSMTYATKLMLVTSLFGSSGYRYYGAIRKSQYAQYQSIHFLLVGICGFLLLVTFVFLGQFLFQIIGENMLTVLSLIFILVGFGLGILEKAILDFYQTIGQIKRKNIRVEASLWFLQIGVGMFIMSFVLINLRAIFILPYPSITSIIIVLVSFFVPFFIIMKKRMKIDHMYERICKRLRQS